MISYGSWRPADSHEEKQFSTQDSFHKVQHFFDKTGPNAVHCMAYNNLRIPSIMQLFTRKIIYMLERIQKNRNLISELKFPNQSHKFSQYIEDTMTEISINIMHHNAFFIAPSLRLFLKHLTLGILVRSWQSSAVERGKETNNWYTVIMICLKN